MPPQKPMERIKTDDFVNGVLTEIKYDPIHTFTYKGESKEGPAVKLIFQLDGYAETKSSGWLKFMYAEKCNLYKKYIVSLVEGAKPFMQFDIEQLKGIKVKILWKDSDDGKYQNIDVIRAAEAKIQVNPSFVAEDTDPETVPF